MTTTTIFRLTTFRCAAWALIGTLALTVGATRADDTAAPAQAMPERCLQLHLIRNTKVVDDHTVLFYLNNNDVYKNVLPHKCGGLRVDETFLYKSSIDQLCSVDVITPLMSTGGTYMRSASCGLGKFEQIDNATAKQLISDEKAARVTKK